MEIQEIVTGALAGDVREADAETPMEKYREEASVPLLLAEGRSLVQNLESTEPEDVPWSVAGLAARHFAAQDNRSSYYRPQYPDYFANAPAGQEMVLLAAEFSRSRANEDLDALVDFISQTTDAQEIVYNWNKLSDRISFLEEIWDDAPDKIAQWCRVSRATVKRWSGGASAGSSAERLGAIVALSFHLRSHLGWSNKEIRSWFATPLSQGVSPEKICETYWGFSEQITEELDRLGIWVVRWSEKNK